MVLCTLYPSCNKMLHNHQREFVCGMCVYVCVCVCELVANNFPNLTLAFTESSDLVDVVAIVAVALCVPPLLSTSIHSLFSTPLVVTNIALHFLPELQSCIDGKCFACCCWWLLWLHLQEMEKVFNLVLVWVKLAMWLCSWGKALWRKVQKSDEQSGSKLRRC